MFTSLGKGIGHGIVKEKGKNTGKVVSETVKRVEGAWDEGQWRVAYNVWLLKEQAKKGFGENYTNTSRIPREIDIPKICLEVRSLTPKEILSTTALKTGEIIGQAYSYVKGRTDPVPVKQNAQGRWRTHKGEFAPAPIATAAPENPSILRRIGRAIAKPFSRKSSRPMSVISEEVNTRSIASPIVSNKKGLSTKKGRSTSNARRTRRNRRN